MPELVHEACEFARPTDRDFQADDRTPARGVDPSGVGEQRQIQFSEHANDVAQQPLPVRRLELDADRAPALPAGFADRLVAAAETRAPALPPLRRPLASRWRTTRRIALGLGAGLLLSSAAAATGVLQQVGIVLPPPVQKIVDDVAQKVTGREPAPPVAAAPAPPVAVATPLIEGPIDNQEELDAVFSRADETRLQRQAQRRAVVDERIDRELERRRAAGLPVPDAEQEAAIRQRIDEARARREDLAEPRREALRNELREAVDQGQPLTRETIRRAREEAGLVPAPGQTAVRREALRRRVAERLANSPVAEPAPAAPQGQENLP